MTYIYRVLRDNPVGLWSFDSASTYPDLSGYGNTGVVSGTPVLDAPIVASGIASNNLTSPAYVTFPFPAGFILDKRGKPFTAELWIRGLNKTTGAGDLFTRDGQGLYFDKNRIFFELGTSVLSYRLQGGGGGPYHIVIVYDGEVDIEMYVNGKLVATMSADAVQVAAAFTAMTTANVKVGPSSGNFSVDSLAVYNYPLSKATIESHYSFGNDYRDTRKMTTLNGGLYYGLSDATTDCLKYTFDTDDDWNEGTSTDVSVVDGYLKNAVANDGTYYAGVWYYVIPFEQEPFTIQGSRVIWDTLTDDSLVTVAVSTDGTTFTGVANGAQPFSNLNLNTAAGGSVIVRVTFTANAVQSVMTHLEVSLYKTKNILTQNSLMTAVATGPNGIALGRGDYEPAWFHTEGGAKFTGSVSGYTIPYDSEYGSLKSVEITFYGNPVSTTLMRASTSGATLTINASGQLVNTSLTRMVVNGVDATSPLTLSANRWNHVIAVFPANTGNFYIGNSNLFTVGYTGRVGYFAVYEASFTAAQAIAIYNAWAGIAATVILDDDTCNIYEEIFTESGLGFRLYTYYWSITGAG